MAGVSCLPTMGLFGHSHQKLKVREERTNCSKMNILHLDESCLQRILIFLDEASFIAASRTCKRIREVSHSYGSWNTCIMQKNVETAVYDAAKRNDHEMIQDFYESCCNAEKLQLNLELISGATAISLWRKMGNLGSKVFSILSKINIDDVGEVWPFCNLVQKELEFSLNGGVFIKVFYKSLFDKQSNFNNNFKLKVLIINPEFSIKKMIFNNKPRGLLNSGILPSKTGIICFEDTIEDESNDERVLCPAFRLIEKELGLKENEITFDFFIHFLQNIDRCPTRDFLHQNQIDLSECNKCLTDALEKARKNRGRLHVEFIRTERERIQLSKTDIDCNGFVYCLAKLANAGGKHVKNLRLKTECIRDALQNLIPISAKLQQKIHLLPKVISNIDFDSIKCGWACINPSLFTIWKEFSIKLSKGRDFKAVITWEEKRDRLNEYSLANKEICLVLQRKNFTTKLIMSKPVDMNDRIRSTEQLKRELKKLVSKVQLRKTGLNGISHHFLFSIFMTILND